MKVYLAGPMSGIPAFNIPAFDAAAAELRRRGFEVVSPAEVDGPDTRAQLLLSPNGDHADLPEDESWSFYLARDFRILHDDGIEAIVCLPGWESSKGADWETYMGAKLGIPHIGLQALTDLQDHTTGGPITPKDLEPGHVAEALSLVSAEPELYDADGKFISFADNPLRQRSATGGVKDNRGKPNLELIPFEPMMAVGRVLGFGAQKYKPNNWRLGLSWLQTAGSALRHIGKFLMGEDIDEESGESHIDCAITQLLFLSTYIKTGTGEDDRWSSLQAQDKEAARA